VKARESSQVKLDRGGGGKKTLPGAPSDAVTASLWATPTGSLEDLCAQLRKCFVESVAPRAIRDLEHRRFETLCANVIDHAVAGPEASAALCCLVEHVLFGMDGVGRRSMIGHRFTKAFRNGPSRVRPGRRGVADGAAG